MHQAVRKDTKPTIVGVGAAYLDVILTLPEFPAEDTKARASACERRRGGNVPNTLEVLGQLYEAAQSDSQAYLFAALPARASVDAQRIRASFPACVSTEHAVFRAEESVAPASYIIRSQASGSRTIVNYNAVGELTLREFEELVPKIVADGPLLYHFEGRIPDVAVQCMRHLREKCPQALISVELEKPNRPGLVEMAACADIVFHSKLWATARGYENAESCVRGQATELPQAEYLFCTWGSQDTAGIHRDGSALQFESCPVFETGLDVVDTVGAGDSFIAAVLFALGRVTPWTLQRTLRFSNEVAGRKVTQEGLKNLAKGMSAWFENVKAG